MTKSPLPFVLAMAALSASAQVEPPRPTVNPTNICDNGEIDRVDVLLPFGFLGRNCIRLQGGFDSIAGSFVDISYSRKGLLHLNETLSLDAEYGVRLHRAQFGFDKNSLLGKPIETSLTVYGQRFNYNQGRESSIFAFQRNIPEFTPVNPDHLLHYVSYGQGVTGAVRYRLYGHSRFGLEYSYDASDIRPLTEVTSQFFSYMNFTGAFGTNELNGVRTSKLIPSFTHTTVNSVEHPTRGTGISISTAIAGVGGNVSTVEPTVDLRYFHSALRKSDVVAFHLFGRLITGYGGSAAPPFDRFYIGGESDLRGFDSWSISPIAYMPGIATVPVLNSDGTRRTEFGVGKNMSVPAYLPVSVGGDTSVVTNLEYRFPIAGPFTMALFTDAGVNRVTFQDQIQLSPSSNALLNEEFPEAGFTGYTKVLSDSEKIRVSTGVELQVRVPKIHAPLRMYFAYNPSVYRNRLDPPVVASSDLFPNNVTYENALNLLVAHTPIRERLYMVRFSIGRTF